MQRQAEMGAMYPQATERLQPPKAGQDKDQVLPQRCGRAGNLLPLALGLPPQESTFLVLPGAQLAWSQQPRDTKIGLVSPQHSTSGLLHLPSQTWTCGGTQPAAKL